MGQEYKGDRGIYRSRSLVLTTLINKLCGLIELYIRALLQHKVQNNILDIKTANLNAQNNFGICMKQPKDMKELQGILTNK